MGFTRTSAIRGTVAAAALLTTLTLMGCPREQTGHRGQADGRSASAVAPATSGAASSSSASSSAADPVPAGPPRVVPSVRSFTAHPGPGWRPARTARVVADPAGPLAAEARTLAADLSLAAAVPPARPGDLELLHRQGQPAEGYELAVRGGRAVITASDPAGAFYGGRTVIQAVRGAGGVPEGVLRDAPDRPQRGLNLDIARKHFSAEWIEGRLREMADLKLNQLALHFSDDQGFRIESESHPEIVSPQHLTKAEVRRIVSLAGVLHITVVPEIDSPGHLGAVINAHPDLQLKDAQGVAFRGAVDISRPAAARIVDDLTREFAPLFPGPWWHLGGDEYRALTVSDPQASFPGLAAAARARYGPQARVQDLATGWLSDRAAVARSLGKRPKAWNDGFFRDGVAPPDKGIEVEYWTGKELGARDPAEYLEEGRTVVNLNDEYLYYVLGEPNDFRYPTGERIYREWGVTVLRGDRAVSLPPGSGAGSASGSASGAAATGPDRVPGGRLAVWCDRPDAQTPEQVAAGIRLPLAAVAQRLWDPRPPELGWAEFSALAGRVVRRS
ncbi:beta-N-acetylhexosaminidase [Streptomyces orinoci]|uniref:Glycoside hydrolase family 20 protein n=1 Tax=Streptomyces orinoci TaxID=67339 RepID=A0ABV3JU95_STRON|nr:glycoside hydrolase family 20 protein [Streptomyces orinoci]